MATGDVATSAAGAHSATGVVASVFALLLVLLLVPLLLLLLLLLLVLIMLWCYLPDARSPTHVCHSSDT